MFRLQLGNLTLQYFGQFQHSTCMVRISVENSIFSNKLLSFTSDRIF